MMSWVEHENTLIASRPGVCSFDAIVRSVIVEFPYGSHVFFTPLV